MPLLKCGEEDERAAEAATGKHTHGDKKGKRQGWERDNR